MVKNKTSRCIIALTGTRSEYDLQYSVAKSLSGRENIDFGFIVFGAHLSAQFGKTVDLIYQDEFSIKAKILTQMDSDDRIGKAKSATLLMNGLCSFFETHRPDLIILAGDREETIIGATIATLLNIPIAHMYGGDRTFPEGLGNVDEQIRHATTKLAHIHFPSHPEHAKRIELMGEEPWRIHCLGSAALDKYRMYENDSFNTVRDYFNLQLTQKKYAVVIHHPLPNNMAESVIELDNILKSLIKNGITSFISYPNNDPGHNAIVELIESYSNHNNIHIYKNLSRDIFIPLIKHSAFLVGNSSMGIVECPYLETPAINVGKRQQGRLNAGNVIFCDSSQEAIESAITTAMTDLGFINNLSLIKNAYGDGFSGEKIADVLSTIEINNKLLAKNITY